MISSTLLELDDHRAESGSVQDGQATVSIVIPCRNEADFIGSCLDSIIASDFPHHRLEVLVVDGMSDDKTREILAKYGESYPFISMLQNQKRITPTAMNLGVKHARGDLIMIMSAHATYEKSFISRSVALSKEYNADNVGGTWNMHPRKDGNIDRAITRASSHPFGVGNALYRTISADKEPRWADTAAYGCYKREVFERIGLFNEQLVHSQDIEFNLRLKKAGGKTLLVPGNVINYYARSGFLSFCKYNFTNGVWVILPFLYSSILPVSWRHLVPLAFVTGLLITGASALLTGFPWLFVAVVASYAVATMTASSQIAWRERDWKYLFLMPLVFPALHIAYGVGSLWGLVKIMTTTQGWSKLFKYRSRHEPAI
jgi:glycosyltransferase involved in cell wall biosynthesis